MSLSSVISSSSYEVEILPRAAAYLWQARVPERAQPTRAKVGRRRNPCGGDVPGVDTCSSAFLWVVEFTDHAVKGIT